MAENLASTLEGETEELLVSSHLGLQSESWFQEKKKSMVFVHNIFCLCSTP